MTGQTPTPATLVAEIDTLLGAAVARPGSPADAIDGVVPGVIAEPPSPAALAKTLAWATEAGRSVLVRGGGTKLGWGASPRVVDLVLSTAGIHRVLEHRHGDLTATVEAGAVLDDINTELSRHRHGATAPRSAESSPRTIAGRAATVTGRRAT